MKGMIKMKRKIALLCALILTASSFVGCSKKTETLNVSEIDASNVTAPGELPVAKEKVTLTVGIPTDRDYNINEYTKFIEEKTNIDLEFVAFPQTSSEANQKLSLMITSGEKLPDVLFNFWLPDATIQSYGSDGYIMPMNELIDKYGYYIDEMFETAQNKDLKKYMKSADGNIYGLCSYSEEIVNNFQNRAWINNSWLDKLGLEMPETTEEFKQVLTAFRDQDPNGNGKKDEVPFSASTTGWGCPPFPFIGNSFIYQNKSNPFVIKDGELVVNYVQDEYKEALKYMQDLRKEGLFDQLAYTQTVEQLKQLNEQGDVSTVGVFTAGSLSSTFGATNERKLEYVPLPPLKGPEGVQYTTDSSPLPRPLFLITSTCEHPVEAFRLGDFMMSEEASMFSRYGVAGRDYVENTEGEAGPYEDLGITAKYKVVNNIWGKVNDTIWGQTPASYISYENANGWVSPSDPLDFSHWTMASVKDYQDKVPGDVVYSIQYTAEESDEISSYLTNVESYLQEWQAKFICTDVDIDAQWPQYLKDIKNIGYERYLEISKNAYSRFKNN